jgi:hypothetical protein
MKGDARQHPNQQVREGGQEEEQSVETRVQSLARQLAEAINEEHASRRDELRAGAIHLLRDEVETVEASGIPAASDQAFNPVAMSIPLFLAAGVLLILFPPVGLLLLAGAVVLMIGGIVTALASRLWARL